MRLIKILMFNRIKNKIYIKNVFFLWVIFSVSIIYAKIHRRKQYTAKHPIARIIGDGWNHMKLNLGAINHINANHNHYLSSYKLFMTFWIYIYQHGYIIDGQINNLDSLPSILIMKMENMCNNKNTSTNT